MPPRRSKADTTDDKNVSASSTSSSTADHGAAMALLKANNWFRTASTPLLESLASAMTLRQVDDGHVFVHEGSTENSKVLLLQEGTLIRSKLALDQDTAAHAQATWTDAELQERSIVIDEITRVGKVMGLLHNLERHVQEHTQHYQEGGEATTSASSRSSSASTISTTPPAFATISATGPAKVWVLSGTDFRRIVTRQPDFALDLMASLAREVRSGSKSLKSVLKQVRETKQGKEDENDATAKNGGGLFRVLCYDATSWTTQGFEKGLEAYHPESGDGGDGETMTSTSPSSQKISLDYTTERLSERSATSAAGYDAVCLFVNDTANASVLKTLSMLGVKLVLMRCAGFDRVDTKAALAYGLTVTRVPAYSPYAVAEMAMALFLSVNRKIPKASNRVRMANFTLDAGLMGMDIHGKTIGVMGTGKIGSVLCDILKGFGVNLLCSSHSENEHVKAQGGTYVSKDELLAKSDVIFLTMPLLPATYHTINRSMLSKLKKGVILINTSRGGLIDTKALLEGLRAGIIGGVGMDVYEEEQAYFYQDWSAKSMDDPDLEALLGNTNVVLTAHQAFFTTEAVTEIVGTTLENIRQYQKGLRGLSHPNNCIPAPPSNNPTSEEASRKRARSWQTPLSADKKRKVSAKSRDVVA